MVHWWKFDLIFFFFGYAFSFYFGLFVMFRWCWTYGLDADHVECAWALELNECQVLFECGHGRYWYLGDWVLP